jgi:hypothetical protein
MGGAAVGTLVGLLLICNHGAIGIAVCALAVIVFYGVRAARDDRQREADKARHPSSREFDELMRRYGL